MNSRPTLKDVAAAAGVSVYVVSRALRGEKGVATSTREKVVRTADDLGYVRNEMAASLRMKSSHTVGILTASGRNQYYPMLSQVIAGTLQKYGYYAVTSDILQDKESAGASEEQSVRLLMEQRPAAIIATYAMSKGALNIIESFQVPIVFVDQPSPANTQWSVVGSDNYQAGFLAGDYLGKLGHRNVLVLSYPSTWSTSTIRIQGLHDAAEKWNMLYEVVESQNTPESAYANISKALLHRQVGQKPDAIFALNILMVMGSYQATAELGWHIGSDISVISIDDFDWAPMLTPPLTVIAQNIDEIGRQAARFVIDAIQGNSSEGQKLTIPVHLIERRSCRRRRTI